MKQAIITILGWISLCCGILFALITIILLLSGKANIAGIFVIPAVALIAAGLNLRGYNKASRA